jgi:hypothetical protein
MEGTQANGKIIDSKAITMVEVEGPSYYVVVDKDVRWAFNGGFLPGRRGERVKKKRVLYDPSSIAWQCTTNIKGILVEHVR